MWEGSRRSYHSVRHLVDLLERIDELQQETHDPQSVRIAAWYHGALAESEGMSKIAERRPNAEVASAEFARADLAALGMPQHAIDGIAEMVEALATHAPVAENIDCAVLCDADLAILAADPKRYMAYAEDLRAEFADTPQRDYLEYRTTVLSQLLARERLYLSPLGAPWEARARQNVEGELMRVSREIAELDAA